jgi:hypothetical protein
MALQHRHGSIMKKYILLGICVVLFAQACKKDNTNTDQPVKTLPGGVVVIPEVPVGTAPETGETPPAGEPVGDGFAYKTLNKALGYNKPLFLDVDADGTTDFTFSSVLLEENDKPYLYLLATTKSGTGNKIFVQNGPDLVINALFTYPFENGQTIEPTEVNNGKWTEIGQKGFILGISETASSKEQCGLWVNKTDKYLGIQFKIAGQVHYGWVKLSHDSAKNEIVVKGFAYHKTGGLIKAGQK